MRLPRVGLLEARMAAELASLVRRHGGEALVAPAVREVALDASAPVGELIDALAAGEVEVVVFLTGVGATGLFAEADRLGRLPELIALLQRTTNVCRGQKPWMPLKRQGVPISVTVPDPYTTADVVRTLSALHPAGRGFAILHYGERTDVLAESLWEWGAGVREVCLYEWRLPEDIGPLEAMIQRILRGELDAVAFTSQVQLRHLLVVATECGDRAALVVALRRMVIAAVGPTCAAALREVGIHPQIVPSNPKMGPMIVALMEHLGALLPERGEARVA